MKIIDEDGIDVLCTQELFHT